MSAKKKLARLNKVNRIPKISNPDPDYFSAPIGWNFSMMDSDSGFPWSCTYSKLTRFRQSILSIEGKSFKDIERENTSNHNWDDYDVLDARARARDYLLKHKIDPGALWQIRLGAKVRLFGVRVHNIFKILWLDTEHQIYKTEKRNT